MDDGFDILQIILHGRNVQALVRKYIQFQLTWSLVATVTTFLFAFIFGESPFSWNQMIWTAYLFDSVTVFAFATEFPSAALLDQKPSKKSDSIVNSAMWRNIIG